MICNRFLFVSKQFFLKYQTFKKSYGFDQNWPYNCNISVELKQKCENLLKFWQKGTLTMCPAVYNEVKILFVSLIWKKSQMERFWNVFETVTKVSKENGFHGNLVTKQNNCLSRLSLYTCIRWKQNLKTSKRTKDMQIPFNYSNSRWF